MSSIIVSKRRRNIEEALALIEKPSTLINARTGRSMTEVDLQPFQNGIVDGIIELGRVCAVHDRLYFSRYIEQMRRGGYVYGGGIRPENYVREQYRAYAANVVTLPNGSLGDEVCPWCGAEGFASILCGQCNFEVCYGRTAQRYFQCRRSCKGEGSVFENARPAQGVRPSLPSPRSIFGVKR